MDPIQTNDLQAQLNDLRANVSTKANSAEIDRIIERLAEMQFALLGRVNALNQSAIVSETDLAGNITYVNDLFCRISKYSAAELLGKNHRILKSGKQPKEIFESLWQTISNGKVWQGIVCNKAKDGSYYWVAATITPEIGLDGKPIRYISVRFDITAIIEQEEELRQVYEDMRVASATALDKSNALIETKKELEQSNQELEATLAQVRMHEEELRQTTEELNATNEELLQIQIQLIGQVNALNNAAIVSETNIAGDITFVNKTFVEISKYSPEELLGQNHRILKSGLQPDEIFIELWQTITAGKVWKGLICNKAKDGSYYWVLSTITPEMGSDEKPQKYIAVRFDVTQEIQQQHELKIAYESLQSHEEELQQTTEELQVTIEELHRTQLVLHARINALNNAAIVSETNLVGDITFANQTFVEISKYNIEELLGQNHRMLKSGKQPDGVFAELWQTISAGNVWRGEICNRAKDGSYYWVNSTITPELDRDGKPRKYIAVRFDITKQIQQQHEIYVAYEELQLHEEELQQTNEELSATNEQLFQTQLQLQTRINALNNAAIVSETNLAGDITFANETFIEISGYTREELLGQNHRILKSGKHPDYVYEDMWRTISSGKVWKGIVCNKKKDGGFYWVSASITPEVGRDGKPIRYISVRFDMTTQVEQEELLKKSELLLERKVEERTYELARTVEMAEDAARQAALAKAEAEQANRTKSTFLANMSHELRTPLNAILGYAQIMLDAPDLPLQFKDKLKILNGSGEHLLDLINGVLDISKIEAGKIDIHFEAFDLGGLLQEVYHLFRLRAEQKNLWLEFETYADVPRYVVGDRSKVKQCLINLIGNSIKFTTQGGIRLYVRRLEDGKVEFEVKDTGRGIPADKIENILQPFTQIHAAQNTEGGTGLGLSITNNFIRLMGGEMRIESQLGVGSTFAFKLHFEEVESLPNEVIESNANIIGYEAEKQIKILVVDDNQINLDVAIEMLSALKFDLAIAKDGKEAIEVYQTFSPDLIFMDIRMPNLDGIEATALIRKINSDVKIIALTASAFDQTREDFIRQGFNDFLAKPYKKRHLFDVIAKHINIIYKYDSVIDVTQTANLTLAQMDWDALFSVLPSDVADQIETNLAIGNFDAITHYLEQLSTDAEAVVNFKQLLNMYIEDFDYASIESVVAILRTR